MVYVLIAIVLLGIWGVTIYNGLINLRVKTEEAFATMDVFLKKRYDLIPNLVETVKGYAKHEGDTLEKVIQARNMAAGATTPDEKIQGENMLAGTLKSLFALSESYPELKANTNFLGLQNQLDEVEGDIANSRKYYNAVVRQFNTKIATFPNSIIAGMFKFIAKPMFEIEEEHRENVEVKF